MKFEFELTSFGSAAVAIIVVAGAVKACAGAVTKFIEFGEKCKLEKTSDT